MTVYDIGDAVRWLLLKIVLPVIWWPAFQAMPEMFTPKSAMGVISYFWLVFGLPCIVAGFLMTSPLPLIAWRLRKFRVLRCVPVPSRPHLSYMQMRMYGIWFYVSTDFQLQFIRPAQTSTKWVTLIDNGNGVAAYEISAKKKMTLFLTKLDVKFGAKENGDGVIGYFDGIEEIKS